MFEYMTVKEAAKKWGLSVRRVQLLCVEGRIEGAIKHASVWAIPQDAQKPKDERIVSGKYIKSKKNNE
ncbi:DNA-binding protein [Fusibacter sp. JL216-2]|uniref:DNA-binding protein n=1 Tax=Fusibacter sp. JL216-2 TaxID=3071453 RepID=UPI003D3440CF